MVLYSCPDHSWSILKNMYDSKIHTDVQLSAGVNGKIISAHRAVLSSATEYFQCMFDGSTREGVLSYVMGSFRHILGGTFRERKETFIIHGINPDILELAIKFIYDGSIEILSPEVALKLLKTAHLLELPQLIKCSEQYLLTNMTSDVCLEVYLQAKHFNNASLTKKAKIVIANEFKNISKTGNFKLLTNDSLVELIGEIWDDDFPEGLLAYKDTLFKYDQGKEVCGTVENGPMKRSSSIIIDTNNNLKSQSQKLFAFGESYNFKYFVLEYDIINNSLANKTEIENNGYMLGAWNDIILFKYSQTLRVYFVKENIFSCAINCSECSFVHNLCCKIGDDVFLVTKKRYHKLNLSTRSLKGFLRPKNLNCYEFDAVCELRGELIIIAYKNNNNTINIVTYNPLKNLWHTEQASLYFPYFLNTPVHGHVVAHQNCLYYSKTGHLHTYNLDHKTWSSMPIKEYVLRSAVSIDNKLIVCSLNGVYEYMVEEKDFKELCIFGRECKNIFGIFCS